MVLIKYLELVMTNSVMIAIPKVVIDVLLAVRQSFVVMVAYCEMNCVIQDVVVMMGQAARQILGYVLDSVRLVLLDDAHQIVHSDTVVILSSIPMEQIIAMMMATMSNVIQESFVQTASLVVTMHLYVQDHVR